MSERPRWAALTGCADATSSAETVRISPQQTMAAPARYQNKEGIWELPAPTASGPVDAAEFLFKRFWPLDDGELDGDAVLEMADDLAAHGAERHLNAERRFDVDLDRGARQREVDDTAWY